MSVDTISLFGIFVNSSPVIAAPARTANGRPYNSYLNLIVYTSKFSNSTGTIFVPVEFCFFATLEQMRVLSKKIKIILTTLSSFSNIYYKLVTKHYYNYAVYIPNSFLNM